MEKDSSLEEETTTIDLRDMITITNGAITPLDEDTLVISDSYSYDYHDGMYNSCVGVDTITLNNTTSTGIYSIGSSGYGSISMTQPIYTNGTITLTGSTVAPSTSVSLGETDNTKQKIYIVEPWQSKKPIQIDDGLWVSLEKDLISTDELKRKIIDKLEETNPDIVVKIGINPDNLKLVKSEVNLEINKEFGDKKW